MSCFGNQTANILLPLLEYLRDEGLGEQQFSVVQMALKDYQRQISRSDKIFYVYFLLRQTPKQCVFIDSSSLPVVIITTSSGDTLYQQTNGAPYDINGTFQNLISFVLQPLMNFDYFYQTQPNQDSKFIATLDTLNYGNGAFISSINNNVINGYFTSGLLMIEQDATQCNESSVDTTASFFTKASPSSCTCPNFCFVPAQKIKCPTTLASVDILTSSSNDEYTYVYDNSSFSGKLAILTGTQYSISMDWSATPQPSTVYEVQVQLSTNTLVLVLPTPDLSKTVSCQLSPTTSNTFTFGFSTITNQWVSLNDVPLIQCNYTPLCKEAFPSANELYSLIQCRSQSITNEKILNRLASTVIPQIQEQIRDQLPNPFLINQSQWAVGNKNAGGRVDVNYLVNANAFTLFPDPQNINIPQDNPLTTFEGTYAICNNIITSPIDYNASFVDIDFDYDTFALGITTRYKNQRVAITSGNKGFNPIPAKVKYQARIYDIQYCVDEDLKSATVRYSADEIKISLTKLSNSFINGWQYQGEAFKNLTAGQGPAKLAQDVYSKYIDGLNAKLANAPPIINKEIKVPL